MEAVEEADDEPAAESDVAVEESPAEEFEVTESDVEATAAETADEMQAETTEEVEEQSATEEAFETEDEAPEDMIQCKVCGEYYHAITEPHLQTHDMTIQEYRGEYGEDVSLRPEDES
jgi:predicted transcriptional regulator